MSGGDDQINPQKLLERRYLYVGLLAAHLRKLRLMQWEQNQRSSSIVPVENAKNDHDEFVERAAHELDSQRNLDRMTNVNLRQLLQNEYLHDQVVHLFQAFQNIDAQLFFDVIDDDDDDDNHDEARFFQHGVNWDLCRTTLLDDREHTVAKLQELLESSCQDEHSSTGAPVSSHHSNRQDNNNRGDNPTWRRRREQCAFLQHKLNALETVLRYHAWLPKEEYGTTVSPGPNDNSQGTTFYDAFGSPMNGTNTDPRMDRMRHYQALNLCRSALIRHRVGYSCLSLASLMPDPQAAIDHGLLPAAFTAHAPFAGRGVFVDGHAIAGSILVFQPGEVWPKEHLSNPSPDVMQHFDKADADLQISLRFDYVLIDARYSPVTILSRPGSYNPWALGHMVNHPPPSMRPNALSLPLDYTERMKLPKQQLHRYIPNVYARVPSWSSRLFDLQPVLQHGSCLLARRDVAYEEICYDYRLQTSGGGDDGGDGNDDGKVEDAKTNNSKIAKKNEKFLTTPDWYSIVQYDDEFDQGIDQVVFFRDDGVKPDTTTRSRTLLRAARKRVSA